MAGTAEHHTGRHTEFHIGRHTEFQTEGHIEGHTEGHSLGMRKTQLAVLIHSSCTRVQWTVHTLD